MLNEAVCAKTSDTVMTAKSEYILTQALGIKQKSIYINAKLFGGDTPEVAMPKTLGIEANLNCIYDMLETTANLLNSICERL